MKRILAALFAALLIATAALAQPASVPLGPSGSGGGGGGGGGSGTVTSVSASDGLFSVGTPTTTPNLTVAGTSGGIPYFNSASTWASSGALAANSLLIGGGAGVAPSSVTTNATVLTALGAAPTGSGGIVLATAPSIASATVTGAFTATGLVTNADLANPSTTVNGVTCTLGSTCTISAAANLTVGTSTITSGTNGDIEFNNAGVLGEKGVTGSGSVALATSPALVTPALGVATGTSLAIGGATLGTNALAVTGLANFASVGSAAAPTLSVGNQTTGFYSVSTTGLGFAINGVVKLDFGITSGGTWVANAPFTVQGSNITTSNNFVGSGAASGLFFGAGNDTILTRKAAANFQLGAVDAAAPVAQTLSVQSVIAGTTNTAGVNVTVNGSVSTGSGTSGDIIFKTGGTGAAATVQNAEVTALTIKGATQLVQLNAITTDATHTDATVCQDTTTHALYFGSGTAGICLGTSSARHKHGITTLDAGLPQIMALQPRRYFLNPGHGDTQKPYYGFLAEDGAGVLPELTGYDADGRPNTFDYLGIVPVLVRAVQEQQAEITALRGQTRVPAQ